MHCKLLLLLLASLPVIVFSQASPGQASKEQRFAFDDASCTDRCHVDSPLYINEYEGEAFKHITHSQAQSLSCSDCHEDGKDVHAEGHGRLTIKKEDCLGCHHVDYKEEQCARCHGKIDSKPMKYSDKPFVHGFDADSQIDCRLCHRPDPKATMEEAINCDNCHHTTPHIGCLGCHERDMDKPFFARPAQIEGLYWTTSFLHSQHPQAELSCSDCHPAAEENPTGVGKYDANCSECHHKDPQQGCEQCHKELSDFFKGEIRLGAVGPIPDKMSRALKCEDCHKLKKGKMLFLEVKDSCKECHNPKYVELLQAQKRTVEVGVGELLKRLAFVEEVGTNPGAPHELKAGVGILELYGVHNFCYARRVMSFLKEGG